MFVEFKEKTFESYFVAELSRKSGVFYCPDQVDEKHLGFDALFLLSRRPWYFFRTSPFGEFMDGITPKELNSMGHAFNKVYPDLKANLFFQFKRPEYLTTPNAKEWDHWKSSYFRFSIYKHQHDILTKLSHCTTGKARVLYAAPKLSKTNALIEAAKKKTLISKTQLVETTQLAKHTKCTFSSSSNTALGHSEPERLETFLYTSFSEEMALLDGESFTEASKRIGSDIRRAFADSSDATAILHSARSVATDGWTDEIPEEFRDSWLDHLITVHAFSRAFGITVCMLG